MRYSTRNSLLKPDPSDIDFPGNVEENTNIIDAALAKCNFIGTADPTVNDDALDGYASGSLWYNISGTKIFLCLSAAAGAASWKQIWPAVATDMDLSAYLLLTGRSPYQIIYGSTDSNGNLYIRSTSNATKGKIYLGYRNTTVYDDLNDRVGIGTATPAYSLHIDGTFGLEGTVSDVGESTFRFRRTFETTVDASNAHTLFYISPCINIANGITNSSYLRGLFAEILRNRVGDSGAIGTQANIQALLLSYGHYNNAAIAPVTTNVYGIYLNPYYKSGTITNLYDLYLAADQTGGTVTNRWGIYQANSALNYFAGNIYTAGNCSALTFTDRTPAFLGDAIAALKQICADENGHIDHASLPEFAGMPYQDGDGEWWPGRSIGDMVSLHTTALQQMITLLEEKDAQIADLMKRLEALEARVL